MCSNYSRKRECRVGNNVGRYTLQIVEKGGRDMFAGNRVEGSSNFLTKELITVQTC
jgi:hypothetical protein